jgi:hypothetical protein
MTRMGLADPPPVTMSLSIREVDRQKIDKEIGNTYCPPHSTLEVQVWDKVESTMTDISNSHGSTHQVKSRDDQTSLTWLTPQVAMKGNTNSKVLLFIQ